MKIQYWKEIRVFFIHAHNEPNRLLHALSKQPHLAAFQKLFQDRKEMRLTLYLPLNKCFNSRSILPEDSNSSLACRRLIFSLTYRPSLWSLFTKRETDAWINFTACNVHNGITIIFQPLEDWNLRKGGGGNWLVSMNGGYQKGEGCKAF